ncbi:helix-turn-helix transcriptional regulator [Paenisporosarcina antarctica]|uniref:Lineage-specific thermal regulator protein n=1 Tax=Paenisporosarcina antarctica TaxID=417367 RepID=A0A4V1AMZ7_9BACL|nr:helix-turn-helix transcriptional regulator [Paenisporosarcina antarctica]QBP41015.1 lineage-specific thermal regulator protein [Paenisporosarcina antarctica]
MEERLKSLKKAMKSTTFKEINFTDEHREKAHKQIVQMQSIDLIADIFPLLIEEKTGTEITQLLHMKGIKVIHLNEGIVYTTLHEAEQNGYLDAYWNEDGEKFYKLSKKGLKTLQKQSQLQKKQLSLKPLLQEVTTNGQ